jgi:hypothetical protein
VTRLDDFFDYDDQPERQARRAAAWKTVLILVLIVLISFGLYKMLRSFAVGTPYVLILAILLALFGLRRVLTGIRAPVLPATLRQPPPRRRPAPAPGDGIRAEVRHWDTRLDYARDDPRHLNHLIRPAIIDIIDERLRLFHGIDRAADPEQAREIMGPMLWTFITEPVRRRVTPNDLATLVAQMEAL